MNACPQCGKTYDDATVVCPDDQAKLTPLNTDGDPLVGKLLDGKYRLLQKVGEGGMGCIYRAVHTEMGRTCAIKLLTAVSPGKEDALARFKREAKMASRIDSAHAVTIYDFGAAEDGTMFLAMEFINGRPLSKIIATERPLPTERVVRITHQIAEGLTAAHALEIVHRDLKPDNIMVMRKGDDNDFVKVLDFGIAKTVADDGADHLTKTGFVLGTPVYMSPEQLLGERLDARSDIYSLAIIVYEMLSGRLPFAGDNPQSVMMKRVTSEPIRLRNLAPRVSDSIERVVMEGLARDPENRVPTAQAFASALQQALMGQTQFMGGRATVPLSDSGGTAQWSSIQTGGDHVGKGTGHAPSSPASGQPAHTDHPPSQPPAQVPHQPTQPPYQPTQQSHQSAEGPSQVAEPQSYVTKRSLGQNQPQPGFAPPGVVPAPPNPWQASVPGHQVASQAAGKRNRGVLLGGGLAALVAIAAAVYFLLPAGVSKFSLTVTGAPAGASVFIDDKPKGTISSEGSLTLSDLAAGAAKLSVKMTGYSEFTSNIEGKADEKKSVAASMLRLEINPGKSASEMVLVDAGEFQMGDDNHDADEGPRHPVKLPAFYIDKYEVSNAQYKKFCDETGHQPPLNPTWDQNYFTDKPDFPVMGIEFKSAEAYANWAGKRLPTEEEWEKAASWDPAAGQKRQYPWGAEPSSDRANVKSGTVAPVKSFPRDLSPYGVYGMGGNVREWVDSLYKPYPASKASGVAFEQNHGAARGGSFIKANGAIPDAAVQSRTSYRNYYPRVFPPGKALPIGFRCALSADAAR
jgi:serine/threonine protein kinase/formylglycine-generating enzyme required for sulfatase activity